MAVRTAPPVPQDADEPLGREVWVVAAVVTVGVIMSILDTTIVNVALETLSRELDASLNTIQWVSTGYLLALAVVIPLTGWMSERFGAKRVWMVSVALFGLGSRAVRPRVVGRVADLLPRPAGLRRRHDHAGRDERCSRRPRARTASGAS